MQPDQLFKANWQILEKGPGHIMDPAYFTGLGMLVGFVTGLAISLFRIFKGTFYNFALNWTSAHNDSWPAILGWLGLGLVAALIVGLLIRNPAIRAGGAAWIGQALENGQDHPWLKILFPKFLGSWLVLAFGVSVGAEGPCIQMGAATALGLKKFDVAEVAERHYYILAGCAAGLAAAFSAPFAGICYVYEIMNAKLSHRLLIFLMAGSMGVYFACNYIFGLGVMLPLPGAALPESWNLWLLVPLAFFSGFVGIAYNYMLRWFIALYEHQKLIPQFFRPILPFFVAGVLVVYLPALTGEGMDIFSRIEFVHVMGNFLLIYLLLKLVFTAFCYGSGIPAGVMVPVLSLGGVAGIIFADFTTPLGFSYPGYLQACLAMGMAGAFAAAERAPLTGLVLVLEMTGAFSVVPGIFLVAAMASFCARIFKVNRL